MVLGYLGSSGPISGANRENVRYLDAESKGALTQELIIGSG